MEFATGRGAVFLAALAVVLARAPVVSASPDSKTLALVVTNNRSTTLALPDLQYADDDGARYYRLFRSVADQDDVVLLTTFDRSSASEYPDLVGLAQPPTLTRLQEAITRLAGAAAEAHRHGQRTTFYLVYAGHGDVDGGRGFIDLDDGQIDGQFIESAILEKIPADTKHVILDSCNSFFVMSPRRPGGRRWATPKDMAMGFAKRHPEVGLFLSTNSDAEVFEWSELESGVFSHEVRSGLSGAADVDGDGNVSYSELAGFVDRANARIARDALRPHVYYRGPNDDATVPLFSPAKAVGRRLVLGDGDTRLWIKNESGERLLDLHKETGPMTLLVPGPAAQAISVYVERSAPTGGGRPTVEETPVPVGGDTVRLAELVPGKPTAQARGDHLFVSLFADPYGPRAYRSFLIARASEPEPVYGISDADVTRMHNYIAAMAADDRQRRLVAGGLIFGLGTVLVASALVSYADAPHWRGFGGRTEALSFAGAGAVLMGGGLAVLSIHGAGENALDTFEKELAASGSNRTMAFARTDQALEDLARRERRNRTFSFWLFEGIGAMYATIAAVGLARPASGDSKLQPSGAAILFGTSAFMIAGGFALRSYLSSPTERLLQLYHSDPDLKVRLGVAPTRSGGMVGLGGSF